jgi:RNA polymerase sigma factor (sigma-70 family)
VTPIDAFEAARPRLFGIAYRMLGSAAEAEDVVQDAWVALQGADDVREPAAWLATVVSRRCLDALKSARARREVYVGPWLPEPIPSDADPDPDTLSLAFLELAERLTPAERAVLVLHEAFGYGLRDVGAMLGKSEANCRKILQRAREHLGGPVRRVVGPAETERLLLAFLTAAQSGDAAALAALLADDVTWATDGGGESKAALRPILGPERCARFALGLVKKAAPDARFTLITMNGIPALATWTGDSLTSVSWVEPGNDGKIGGLRTITAPSKLAGLRSKQEN